ncbi:protease complex subunit PrcB family protein [Gilvimarinus agarilyticus]|uniref:protease complex subunit PrcB family protein n=1 Tax=Gilvimarinus agarilyticus TaxID=679259 RepID=UPI0005A15858|nr:protease complex subunit PrcB family protein [Gilvimarinus agarilyticus]
MKPMYLIAPLLLVMAGCDSSDDNDEDIYSGTPHPYSVIECGQSSYSTITEPNHDRITSTHDFREIYGITDLNKQGETPSVDFDTKQVIAIHAGEKANPGHALRVDEVLKDGDSLKVLYTTITPSNTGECNYPDMGVYPYCFIAMDKTELPINYVRKVEEGSCSR